MIVRTGCQVQHQFCFACRMCLCHGCIISHSRQNHVEAHGSCMFGPGFMVVAILCKMVSFVILIEGSC